MNHPDLTLSLREAFEKYYDKSELAHRTLLKINSNLKFWERITGDPAIGEVTNATIANFRESLLLDGMRPTTVNSHWRTLRAIFRRLGPQETYNPAGEGILVRVPYMKAMRTDRRIPRRITQEEFGKTYIACRHATDPKATGCAAEWWRCLLVLAYTTGLRRSDLLGMRRQDINLERHELVLSAQKTGRTDVIPLHPLAVEHIKRLWTDGPGLLFGGVYSGNTSATFYTLFYDLQRKAGIVKPFSLHDIRRAAANEIDRVQRGLGAVLLQHAPRTVTQQFYENATEELRSAIREIRIPGVWRQADKIITIAERKRQERIEVTPSMVLPSTLDPADWHFGIGYFQFRGVRHMLPPIPLRLLKALVKSGEPVPLVDMLRAAYGSEAAATIDTSKLGRAPGRIAENLRILRTYLRQFFGLAPDYDPVPCMSRGNGGAWTLWLPPEAGRKAEGGAA